MSKDFSLKKFPTQQPTQHQNKSIDNSLHEPSIDHETFRSTKPQHNFVSSVPREFLVSVSKEIRQNPGPGSYLHDQLMKDKMRALSYQVCQRYQMNPFGTGNPRFEY